jgi:protein SCO1/2
MDALEKPGPHSRSSDLRRALVFALAFAATVTVAVFVIRTVTRPADAPAFRLELAPAVDAQPEAPPILYDLPDFRLTNERGQPFGLADLRGRTWIASFFFTSCPTICPRLMSHVARVQSDTAPYGESVRLVSISVDPATDTPARLFAQARKYAADPARWTFLTGPIPEIERAVKQGFKQAMDRQVVPVKNAQGEDAFDIVHGSQLVLVDAQGRIRGYYDSTDEGRGALLRALSFVAGPSPAKASGAGRAP